MTFHADWCGFCKAMGPLLKDFQNKYDGTSVLFVTLDRTNRHIGIGAYRRGRKGFRKQTIEKKSTSI